MRACRQNPLNEAFSRQGSCIDHHPFRGLRQAGCVNRLEPGETLADWMKERSYRQSGTCSRIVSRLAVLLVLLIACLVHISHACTPKNALLPRRSPTRVQAFMQGPPPDAGGAWLGMSFEREQPPLLPTALFTLMPTDPFFPGRLCPGESESHQQEYLDAHVQVRAPPLTCLCTRSV